MAVPALVEKVKTKALVVYLRATLPITRLALASVLGPFGVHLLKFILPTPGH